MKYKFIPVNNDLNKAKSFANTLDYKFIKNTQKHNPPQHYIETLNPIQLLQKEGWELYGVAEDRNKRNRKITSNYAQMRHPGLNFLDKNGKKEALATITISNSCNGKKPLELDLGMFRLVCSNGLISKDSITSKKIKHTEINYNNLESYVATINDHYSSLSNTLEKFRNKNLSSKDIRDFAYQAARMKFKSNKIEEDYIDNLLKVDRKEDIGNNIWSVFNRVQESLTQEVDSFKSDIHLNKELFSLAESYV